MKLKNVFFSIIISVGLSFQAVAADYNDFDEQPNMAVMAVDGLLVRPLTLGVAAVGFVGWVVTLPFSIPGGNAGEVGEAWVSDPLTYTFYRPLGEMAPNTPPRYSTGGDN